MYLYVHAVFDKNKAFVRIQIDECVKLKLRFYKSHSSKASIPTFV